VSLEDAFWDALKLIAATRNIRLSDLVTTINKKRGHAKQRGQ
jgi:predicted DNA-binding ribbon-helix-helix protein